MSMIQQGLLFLIILTLHKFTYAKDFNITTPVNAVYVQHKETKLYVGKQGGLCEDVKDAQGFFISLADARGNIVFVTKEGGKALKVANCRLGEKPNLKLELAPLTDNQIVTKEEYFLTVNNDYSIGSRCGKNLLVVPDRKKTCLIAMPMDQCRNKNSTAFDFINVNSLEMDDPEPGVDTKTVSTL